MKCLNCNTELIQIPKKREKQFCNSTCRSNYWQKAKRKVKGNSKPDVKKKILEERNRESIKKTNYPMSIEEMFQQNLQQIKNK